MNLKKYDRALKMLCSTCGNSEFEYKDDAGPVRCTSCDRVFGRSELINENSEIIESEVDLMKAKVMTNLSKILPDFIGKDLK